MYPNFYQGYSDNSRSNGYGYDNSRSNGFSYDNSRSNGFGYDSDDSHENIYKQRKYGTGFNRATVQQPSQQNSQQGYNSQRSQENSNGKRANPSLVHITNPANRGYYETWENNINLEEAAQKNERSQGVEVDCATKLWSQKYVIAFQKTFKRPTDAKYFIKTVRGLTRVRCVARPPQSNIECPLYQGNIVEVKPESSKCEVQVEFSPESFRDIEAFLKTMNPPWRIEEDKLAFFQQMRDNLEKLSENPEEEQIFIHKAAPEKTQDMSTQAKILYSQYVETNSELNKDQKIAIKNCLTTTNYNLVLGMPGTGKTHVIVILLKIFISLGKKVLVTSYTHSAIDNILKRFVRDFPDDRQRVVRFGSKGSIDPEVVDLAYNPSSTEKSDDEDDEDDEGDEDDILKSKRIFAVTCLGAGAKALEEITFDTCIVDEASQIVEPILIGPLLKTDHFILFGDHNQMPPLVKSDEAKKGKMDISLFEKLAEEHEDLVSYLTTQYRMNENIMRFSNSAVYGNRMTCGTEKVRTGKIPLGAIRSNIAWIPTIFNPQKNVIFLDLGKVRALHKEDTKNLNCLLTCFIAKQLLIQEIRQEDIGIISALKDDRKNVDAALKDYQNLNRYTIDTCQGIDRSCIIMNLSLNANRVRPLLSRIKRVNVAFTRAKHKLIIIGSFHDLKNMEGIGSFLRQLHRQAEREIFDYKMLKEAGIVE